MKSLLQLTSLFFILSLVGCGSSSSVSSSEPPLPTKKVNKPNDPLAIQKAVEGSWFLKESESLQYYISFTRAASDSAETDTATLGVYCVSQDESQAVQVSVTVAAAIQQETIEFIDGGKDSKTLNDGTECAIEVIPAKVNYDVSDTELTLYPPEGVDGDPITFINKPL